MLFADLRGSTSLYERLGNAEATSVVTHTVNALGASVIERGGQVVKTLGDGLMAVFETPAQGVDAAMQMHETLERLVQRGSAHGASAGLRGLRLQVALARGEVVEMAGDCFGDAVNVAARVESLNNKVGTTLLITADVYSRLSPTVADQAVAHGAHEVKGRDEPVSVYGFSD